MPHTPYEQMQRTVDIVNDSPHPTNKIAATLFGRDPSGHDFSIAATNYWPDIIRNTLGTETRIGNASGTIHAETACILQAPYTDGASMCITDPFCPNCAKNMAEAGIKTIYIDHKGFEKDFIARRHAHFTNMSMRVCEKAGIAVYELYRKEQRLIPIYEPDPAYTPPEEAPIERAPHDQANTQTFKTLVHNNIQTYRDEKFACALAKTETGAIYSMTARAHPALGYTMTDDSPEIEHPQGKYSFLLEPVNRLLMAAPRHGLKIIDGYLYDTQVPTSREQVNLVGANLTRLTIGDPKKARDPDALRAMRQMQDHKIIRFSLLYSEFC